MDLIVNIDVADIEQAIAFYTDALGLRLARRLFGGSVAELHGATSIIQLLLKESGSSPAASSRSRRDYTRHWTPVHLDFAVDDIRSQWSELCAPAQHSKARCSCTRGATSQR